MEEACRKNKQKRQATSTTYFLYPVVILSQLWFPKFNFQHVREKDSDRVYRLVSLAPVTVCSTALIINCFRFPAGSFEDCEPRLAA